jgi:NTP pyrophosphatase (non-canonical NTP hydrolase)
MTFDEYQRLARQTAIYPNVGSNLWYPTLGLAGEAGEVAEKVKKLYRDNFGDLTPKRRESIAKELGDVLWYVANVAEELDYSLDLIAKGNLCKLKKRKKEGKLQGEGDDR